MVVISVKTSGKLGRVTYGGVIVGASAVRNLRSYKFIGVHELQPYYNVKIILCSRKKSCLHPSFVESS